MKKNLLKLFLALSCIAFTITSVSCVSSKVEETPVAEENVNAVSRSLTGVPVKNARQLYRFFIYNNPDANRKMVKRLSKFYIQECKTEGINSDCAFIQMCHETGFLRFGNLVQPEWHNYCGLGAINAENPGLKFKTERLGVRAHIQHLHAYATTADVKLKNECIDPRYKYVSPRAKAPDVFGLAGTWAADKLYGEKLDKLLSRLEEF